MIVLPFFYHFILLHHNISWFYLLVDLGELFQVVLQEGDLLFLSHVAKSLLTVQLSTLKNQNHRFNVTPVLSEKGIHMNTIEVMYLLDPRGEVLNEEFAQVVKRLQLFGLREQKENDLGLGIREFFQMFDVVGSILGLLLNNKMRVIKCVCP